jgi:riboflavin kinase
VTALRGVVASGLGHGAGFLGVPWVRDGIRRLTGFDPWPGTFNVRLVDPGMLATWRRLGQGRGLRLEPPTSGECGARLFPATVAPDVGAAVIVPDVTDHAADVLEVVAPVHVRRALGLRDGDAVTLEVTESPYTASSL